MDGELGFKVCYANCMGFRSCVAIETSCFAFAPYNCFLAELEGFGFGAEGLRFRVQGLVVSKIHLGN